MPNAFSPNGDGLNDGFGILTSTALVKYSLVVYDRWGELVFTTTEKRNRWDGTFKGKPMPVGTYSWILGYQTITDNQYYTRKGTVSLVR
jgi:gliding motility-associated-like protein